MHRRAMLLDNRLALAEALAKYSSNDARATMELEKRKRDDEPIIAIECSWSPRHRNKQPTPRQSAKHRR